MTQCAIISPKDKNFFVPVDGAFILSPNEDACCPHLLYAAQQHQDADKTMLALAH
jgi:hypothetical protein